MKITVVDVDFRQSKVFNSRVDAGRYVGVTSQTLRNWQRIEGIKYHSQFIICFDTEIIKSKGKIRDNNSLFK
jgi:hypothetical protein